MKVWAKPEKLKRQRIKRGFSSAALAAELEMTRAWWSKVENGQHPTSPETAAKVCKLLLCKFDQVFEIRDG